MFQLPVKFQTATASCWRFIWITNSSDHRRVSCGPSWGHWNLWSKQISSTALSQLFISFSAIIFNESGSWFSRFWTLIFPNIKPEFPRSLNLDLNTVQPQAEPRFFPMLNLDFSQRYFQFWMQILPITFEIANLEFPSFPNFYVDFPILFGLISINVAGYYIHFWLCSVLHFLSEYEISYMKYIKSFNFADSTIVSSIWLNHFVYFY